MGLKLNRSERTAIPARFLAIKWILFMPSALTSPTTEQAITKDLHLEMTAVDERKKIILPKSLFNKLGYCV